MIERGLPKNSYRTKKKRFRFVCGIVGIWISQYELLCCFGQRNKMAGPFESHAALSVADFALSLCVMPVV
jgi:hypothetical protein